MHRKTTLDNGMILVTERMEHVRSVSLGIWVRAGSREEAPGENGISHFLEHMFFKGTASRSAEAIAIEADSIGGELNAFTSKEGTTFYIKVLDEYIDRGIGLLADIFTSSTFPVDEIEKEKGVIIEEIRMVDDTPDELIHDLFYSNVWGRGPGLGLPVLGTEETVTSFTRDDLTGYVNRHYRTMDTVIAASGNFDHDRLTESLNRALGTARHGSDKIVQPVPVFHPGKHVISKPLAEAHVCIGLSGIRQASPDRYGALLLNTILGGGISSRLFQEIREKHGLVYTVYSFLSSYVDAGLLGIYAGTGMEKVDEVLDRCNHELYSLPGAIREDELARAKAQVKASVVLGLESSSRRMQNIASQEIYYGSFFTPDEIIAKIDGVGLDEVQALAARLITNAESAVVILGPA